MKDYTYYWYHGRVIRKYETQDINKIILEHDWEKFSEIKAEFDKQEKNMNFCSFPDHISEFDDSSDEIHHIPLNKENFKLITSTESENG